MKLKTLYIDIETSHNLLLAFSLFNKYSPIPFPNIEIERYIICAAWQWEGQEKVHGVSLLNDKERFKEDVHDDFHVVQKIHSLLEEADAVVAHFGNGFDIPFCNTRFLFHDLGPTSPYEKIDTYKLARSTFLFNSNKLDYIAQYLDVGSKMETKAGLWRDCFAGKQRAIREMLAYNKQDIEILRDVYQRMRPYFPTQLNHNLMNNEACPKCGAIGTLTKQGTRKNKTRVSQQYRCTSCGGWSTSTVSDKNVKAVIK